MPSQFNLASNVAGIQGHSQGELFPVVQYTRGEARRARLGTIDVADTEDRTEAQLLKLADEMTDQGLQMIAQTGGFSFRLVNDSQGRPYVDGLPAEGYMVSMAEGALTLPQTRRLSRYDGSTYEAGPDAEAIRRWIYHSLDWLLSEPARQAGQLQPVRRHYLGGWAHGGRIYLDRSRWTVTFAAALQIGQREGQIAVWDIAEEEAISC